MDRAVSYLISNYNPKGQWIGWLMMASILVEAWDLYSIAFVLIFIRDIFHPSPALLGLAAAGTQGGAIIGALLGGWLADKLGRRIVFLSTMGMFVIFALAQAFVPNIAWLVVVRLILGIPLGSDISSGYTYIMESMPRGEREVMGNRWQFMFALGKVLTLAVIAIFIIADLPHDRDLARDTRPRRGSRRHHLLSAPRPAGNCGLAHSPRPVPGGQASDREHVWRSAGHAAGRGRPDPSTAPDGVSCRHPQGSDPLARHAVRLDRLLRAERGVLHFRLLHSRAVRDGWGFRRIRHQSGDARALRHRGDFRLGRSADYAADRPARAQHRRLCHRVPVALLVAAAALYTGHVDILPFAAAAMLWGHYWDAENVVTIPAMVARPEYRGTATGFAYVFVKLPAFLAIFLFPVLFSAIGQANATLFTALFPLAGLLAAIFILPEVYGFEHD